MRKLIVVVVSVMAIFGTSLAGASGNKIPSIPSVVSSK